MKKCKNCGKLYFVLGKEGLCKKCLVESRSIEKQQECKSRMHKELLKKDPSYAKISNDLQLQEKLLSDVNLAKEKFKSDHDIQAAISVYERALLNSNPPLKSDSHTMYLSNLYIQAGEYDKDWAYLNNLLINNASLTDKIRKDQCRILKKEKNYSEAMQMLVLSFLADAKWKNLLRTEAFVKEATPIANKLGWSDEIVVQIVECIQYHVEKKNYDEASMIADFRKKISEINK